MAKIHPAVKALRAHMEANDLSCAEVAERIGAERTGVWRWLNGERIPNTESIKAISAMTDKPVETLL